MKTKRLLLLLAVVGVFLYLGSIYAYAQETGLDSSVTQLKKDSASPVQGREEEPKKSDFALSEPIPALTQIDLDEIEGLEEELEEEETEDEEELEDEDKAE